MKVKALIGFVSRHEGKKYIVTSGQEMVMPEGADWLRAGLVEAVEEAETPKPARKRKNTDTVKES